MDAIEWITLTIYVALIVGAAWAGHRCAVWWLDRRNR
jgi:hypothetical protein